jgi:hypothetical protein
MRVVYYLDYCFMLCQTDYCSFAVLFRLIIDFDLMYDYYRP